MSLDFYLVEDRPTYIFDANVTHNLTAMADAVGLYIPLWRPEEIAKTAKDLVAPIECGLAKLEADPEHYRKLDPPNGWGDYDGLVEFASEVLNACRENPNARIEVSR